MAYGDSFAAIIGRKYGRTKLTRRKTLEGALAMFTASLVSIIISLAYFSHLNITNQVSNLYTALAIAIIVTLVELASPKGFDNIAVPLLGALGFYILEELI